MAATQEPLLLQSSNRFTYYPLLYPALNLLYKKAQASLWTAEEVDLADDQRDWERMTAGERHFIKQILAFFAGADGIVIENAATRFLADVQVPEARAFYALQVYVEQVHSETYALLLESYVRDTAERASLFGALETLPAIKAKGDWAKEWMASDRPFGERLVAFACVEGIHFSSSFCAIFWMRKRGLLPGLCFANELISRDEGLHTQFACELFRTLASPPSRATVAHIVCSAVAVEQAFATSALPVSLIGMNCDAMRDYVEYVADFTLGMMGMDPEYGTQNPFEFMELISLQGKTNFFEKRVGEYQKANVMASVDGEDHFKFTLEADF